MVSNIIDRYIQIVEEEFKDYSKLILGKKFNNEIFNNYFKDYVESRYYNFLEIGNKKTFRNKILRNLNITQEKLEKNTKISKKTISLQLEIFKNLLVFDNVSIVQTEESAIKNLHEIYKINLLPENADKFEKEFFSKNKKYISKKKELKKKYETKNFQVKYKKIDRNGYITKLTYNIKFPKIYNLSFIDEAFNTGITKEDKLLVEYSIVSKDILNEILEHNFKKKYVLEFAGELLGKSKKIKQLLNILNSPPIQEKVSLQIYNKDFIKYKNKVYELMKDGYKFTILLDDKFDASFSNIERLNMFEYVIVNENFKDYDKIKSKLKNLIIYKEG